MRGGARKGAGRPLVPKEQSKAMPNRTIRLTDTEYQTVKDFIKQLREEKKNEI